MTRRRHDTLYDAHKAPLYLLLIIRKWVWFVLVVTVVLTGTTLAFGLRLMPVYLTSVVTLVGLSLTVGLITGTGLALLLEYQASHTQKAPPYLLLIIRKWVWFVLVVTVVLTGTTLAFGLRLMPVYLTSVVTLVGLSLTVGLIAGTGLAFLLEYRDSSWRLPGKSRVQRNPESAVKEGRASQTSMNVPNCDDIMSRPRRRVVMLLITLTVFFDELIYSVVIPILPRQAVMLGWSEVEIGLLVGSLGLSGLATAPFVGRLSRRLGTRRLFLAGLVLLATGTGLCAVGTAYGWILTGRLLQGVSVAVTSAVGMAYIVKISPADQRGRAMGIMAVGFTAGSIAGPATGGVLFARVGYSNTFVLILLCVLILALASVKALPEGHASREGKESFRALLARPQVRLLVLCAALSMGILGMFEAIVPLHLARNFGTGPTAIGLVFVGAALGQGLASPLAGGVADYRGTRFTMLAGLTLLAVTMIAVSVSGSVSAIAASLCATGLASAFALVPSLSRMAELGGTSDATSHSTAYALLNSALDTGMMVGPLLGGALVGVLGFTTGILVASAVLFAGVLLSNVNPE